MTHNPTQDIRHLPIYQLGFRAGQDVGLRIALDALTGARTVQAEMLTHAVGLAATRHEHTLGVLEDVAHTVAARFWQS